MNLLILLRIFFALWKTGAVLSSSAFIWIRDVLSRQWEQDGPLISAVTNQWRPGLMSRLYLHNPGFSERSITYNMNLIGIDMAWQSEKNTSAAAVGELKGAILSIHALKEDLDSVDTIADFVSSFPEVAGVTSRTDSGFLTRPI